MKKILSVFSIVILFLLNIAGAVSIEAAPVDASEITTNGNGGKTDVGMWYVTCNNEEAWVDNLGTEKMVDYLSLLPDGSYGIPDSGNSDIIDFHLEKLSEAKVDFILIDLTEVNLASDYESSNTYQNALLTCERIANWNKNNSWKIRYAFAIGVFPGENEETVIGSSIELQAKLIYEKFYSVKDVGRDNYYQMNKTPLLVVSDSSYNPLTCTGGWNTYTLDRTYGDKFTLRSAKSGEEGSYGFYNSKGVILNSEVELISAGYNSHSLVNAELPRNNGDTYKNNWETVLNNATPRIVMLSSFNDYNSDTALFITDTSLCDNSYEEQWTDRFGLLNDYMYWDITKEGIIKLRLINGDSFSDLPELVAEGYLTVKNFDFVKNDETENENSENNFSEIAEKDENNNKNKENEVKNYKKNKIILVILLNFFFFGVIIIYTEVTKKRKNSLSEEKNE